MQKAAQHIVEKLRRHGFKAYFAGGWVRDLVLARKPKDLDIATSASPDDVQRLFSKTIPVGAQYGVVQVRIGRQSYEVTTFRSEGPYLDGRHPSSVRFSGPREDAMRRDFTINGMFYDPFKDRVIDYVRGKRDLQRRILRTIGQPKQRFGEDKLRMLRGLRFACNLGFAIEPDTWTAIKKMAPEIVKTSWERIRDELLKILTGTDPARGLALLHESGMLAVLLPEVEAMCGVDQPAEFHPEGDVFVHTLLALGMLRKPTPILALGTLLHDVGKPDTFSVRERIRFDGHVELGARKAEQICRRLRMSNEETAAVVNLVLNHLRFMHAHEMRAATLQRFLRKPDFPAHLELHRVDCLSSHRKLDTYYFCRGKLRELKKEPVAPPALITGDDLIDLGYTPGPAFKEILRGVEDKQIEKDLRTREEAIAFVLGAYPLTPRRQNQEEKS